MEKCRNFELAVALKDSELRSDPLTSSVDDKPDDDGSNSSARPVTDYFARSLRLSSSTSDTIPLPRRSFSVGGVAINCHGSTGSPSALSEEDSKGGRDGSRGDLRVEPGHFCLLLYENPILARFEAAVRVLNPVVAVKVRSAEVHAALATVYVHVFYLLLY